MGIAEQSLYSRTIKSGFWVFLFKISQRILQIIKLVIVARIINPHDFGLIGIALLVIAILETFSQTGFERALIQKKGDIHSLLDTAWTASILRGGVLFTIAYIFAPYVAIFFNVLEVKLIIQVIGVSFLFRGLTNIGIIYFKKEIEFKKEFLYQISGVLVDFIVTVSIALTFKNVWALVFGHLAGHAIRLVASYVIHPLRPRFRLKLEELKKLLSFGKWIFGSSILSFLIIEGDDIFVSKFLGVTALGFYQMAYKVSNLSATEITQVISQVVFPVYSKIQDNIARLREAYLRVLQLTSFLAIPLAGLIFVLAPDFIRVFLGVKWMPMVGAMKLLALWGGIRAIGATSGAVFLGVGKPKILAKIQFVNLILILILIYPFSIRWSIEGTAMAIIFATLIPVLWAFHAVCRQIKCKWINVAKTIIFPLLSTFAMVAGIFLLKAIWLSKPEIWGIAIFVLVATGFYLGMMYIFGKLFGWKMQEMLQDSWQQLRKLKNV